MMHELRLGYKMSDEVTRLGTMDEEDVTQFAWFN